MMHGFNNITEKKNQKKSYNSLFSDCPSTYKDFGAYKNSEESYAYFDISISECKAQCSSDVRCLGFGYNSAISRCYLSEYNSPDSEEECPTCTFSRKECVASFDVTTTANPELHVVTSDTTSSDTVGITYGITESTRFSIQETGTLVRVGSTEAVQYLLFQTLLVHK